MHRNGAGKWLRTKWHIRRHRVVVVSVRTDVLRSAGNAYSHLVYLPATKIKEKKDNARATLKQHQKYFVNLWCGMGLQVGQYVGMCEIAAHRSIQQIDFGGDVMVAHQSRAMREYTNACGMT